MLMVVFHVRGGRSAATVFCTDADGNFPGASAMVFAGTLESLACREALMLANDLQLNNLKVASDCKTVIGLVT